MKVSVPPPIRRRPFPPAVVCGCVYLVILGFSLPGQAQEAKGSPAPAKAAPAEPSGEWTEDSLTKALEELKADSTLDEPAKAAVAKILETALASVKAAVDSAAKTEAFRRDFDQAPAEIGRIRGELAARQSGKAPTGVATEPPLPKDAPAEAINARLASEKSRLSDQSRILGEFDDQLAAIETRPNAIRDRLTEARRLLNEAATAQAAWQDRPANTAREKAERAQAQAAHLALRREVEMLDQEALSLDLRRSLLEARRDLADSDQSLVRSRVTALQARAEALVNARIGEAERLVGEADLEAVREVAPVRQLMEETRRLSTETQAILDKINTAGQRLRTAEIERDNLRRDAENIRAEIEIGGLGDSFTQVVLEMRQRLPSARDYRATAEERRKSISTARLAAFRADRELKVLPPPDERLDLILASLGESGVEEAAVKKLRPVLETLIDTHRRLLVDLAEENRRLSRQLGEVDLVEGEIVAMAEQLKDYLGEKLLWVASSPPMDFTALTGIPAAVNALAGPTALAHYASALARIDWPRWLLLAATALVLLLPRRRLRAFLAESGKRTRRISSDGLSNTFRALAATFFLALPLPAGLWLVGTILRSAAGELESVYAMGVALIAPALYLLAISFTSHLCRSGGVGEAHFRWDRELTDRLRHAIYQAAFAYMPALWLLTFWLNCKDPAHFQGPGRLVFLLSMLALSGIVWRLLGGAKNILDHFPPKSHWLFRLRSFWVPVITGIPIALAGLAALGHFLTALALAYQIQITALLILAGIIVYGVLSRWAILKERRLALREAIAEREARLREHREAREPAAPGVTEQVVVPEVDEAEFDLGVMGGQTRRLIAAFVIVGILGAIWVTWSEVIPVLKYLDTGNLVGNVSIADLITLGLGGVVITVLFQNLPGLLEVAFLRTLDLDTGLRNAIVTLCQYAVIAIGAFIAFHIIGLDWSQFGWIAAALSVGLGFGLQEVVANFVSGLIILFERPIRVGDVVTVAGVDGVVSRIRIRATTITNWDRKEFVVPNKEFVTGTLLNWTLSSSVTRLVIPVGIAYGSDTEKVHDLLIEIARSHPEVLTDPAPQAVFELFGDSTLNFSLRCFLPSPAERLDATHYINSEIHRRFAEAGIEIAYPRRDLHIRSIDPSVRFDTREGSAT